MVLFGYVLRIRLIVLGSYSLSLQFLSVLLIMPAGSDGAPNYPLFIDRQVHCPFVTQFITKIHAFSFTFDDVPVAFQYLILRVSVNRAAASASWVMERLRKRDKEW